MRPLCTLNPYLSTLANQICDLLILLNLWLELRWCFARIFGGGTRKVDEERFQLQRMASFLNRAIERSYGVISCIEADVKPP